MRRHRPLLIVIALLSIFTLGSAATVLESSTIESSYSAPTETESDGGPGMNIFFALVLLLLELLGIETVPSNVPSLLEQLDGVLMALRPVAFPLLLVVAVIPLLASRRLPRSSIGTIDVLLTHWFRSKEPSRSTSTTERWPPAEPDPGVSEAWVAMTDRLEADHPRARTPSEWAESAIDAGFDRDAVTSLTALYRETRYGGTRETPEHRRRATRELERLEGDRGR